MQDVIYLDFEMGAGMDARSGDLAVQTGELPVQMQHRIEKGDVVPRERAGDRCSASGIAEVGSAVTTGKS